jgi:uracil-DNA glycosylase
VLQALGPAEARDLDRFLDREFDVQRVLPKRRVDVFRAFALTPFDRVRVVIVGQDPYPNADHAMGLAFSVPTGVRPLPLSLRNIDHELQSDEDIAPALSGDLTRWAEQGVLLLNDALTVGVDRASHTTRWRTFTDCVIDCLVGHPNELVFVLWGKSARAVAKRVQRCDRHHVICGAHPVATSGFFGERYFSRANALLPNDRQIDWDRAHA